MRIYHGLTHHELYNTWYGMMGRCYNPKHPSYKNYGARGIVVCERWHSTQMFITDIEQLLGPRPPGMTLDRKDNDGPYIWWNVQWATRLQQAVTRRSPPKRGSDYKHSLYHVWIRMRARHPGSVCEQWERFPVFAADIGRLLGPRPENAVFRRIDWERPFEPGNVHWGVTGRPGPRSHVV